MPQEGALTGGVRTDTTHWVEVIDRQGCFPARWLGPYPSVQHAARACRGVLRLLNPARYTAVIRLQEEVPGGRPFPPTDGMGAPCRAA